jgi:large subunit ribosomal protein L24
MRIMKGDTVSVLTGKDKGKTGKVAQAFPSLGKVVVEGVNLAKKHLKARGTTKGQTVEAFAPVNVSNVMLVCPKCSKPTRVGVSRLGEGASAKKVRQCKKCNAAID